MATGGRAPVLELKAFPLKAAAWANEHEKNGKRWTTYSVKLTKSYKDDKGQWQETSSLFDDELLGAAALLLEVWRALKIKERGPKASGGGEPAPAEPDADPFR